MIAAGILLWILPATSTITTALTVAFKGALLVWAVDEIVRGVNPWRRFLGAVVAVYELSTVVSLWV